MIIVMQPHASEAAVQTVVQFIRAQGLTEHLSRGTEHTIIGAVGDERVFDPAQIEALPEVERAIRIVQDWRIISREAWADDSQIIIRGIPFGGTNAPQTIAYIGNLKTAGLNEVKTGKVGSGETETSKPQSHAAEISEVHAPAVLLDPFYLPANPYAPDNNAGEADIARQLQHCGAHWHRAQKAVAVRIRDSAHIQAALNAEADLLYLGGELINNRHILHELGSLNVPVVVCKDIHHTVRDWLIAAEQIALRGNQHILLGEAGTLSLHSAPVRLDVEAIAQAKQQSHLPVLANISTLAHRHMPVATLRRLAIAAGADVIIE
ncbi:3-deoxy-D-arabino-heptulosonate 7-phosphate synthase [Kingella oralis]|uniref:3-deoxy-D-arabino-heptulosonate 7-phosphate synthase n=1 Tax=Kingella oralis TaxID=505 RepID=UPI0034E5B415